MNSANDPSTTRLIFPEGLCLRRCLLGIGIAALLIAGLGRVAWQRWRSARVRDWRQAVEQGRDYLRQGRPDLAFQTVSDARDDEIGSGEAVSVAAMALVRMGELRVARQALERALRLQPNQFEATVTLAELHVDLGNGWRGAELFETAARIRPREPRVWLALARVLQDLAELPRSIQAYEKVVDLDPDQREALLGLIHVLLLNHEADRAEPWVAKAIAKYPDDPVVLGLAARQSYDRNRLDEASSLSARALALRPDNLDALVARSRCLVATMKWDQALLNAERAVASSPANLEALQILLLCETRLDLADRAAATRSRIDRARKGAALMNELTRESSLHPEDPQFPWRVGLAALEAGSTVLATRCFEAALALDPNYEPARQKLAELRSSQPRTQK
jgi:tetratricopeptide (TPR) repeat protein